MILKFGNTGRLKTSASLKTYILKKMEMKGPIKSLFTCFHGNNWRICLLK